MTITIGTNIAIFVIMVPMVDINPSNEILARSNVFQHLPQSKHMFLFAVFAKCFYNHKVIKNKALLCYYVRCIASSYLIGFFSNENCTFFIGRGMNLRNTLR